MSLGCPKALVDSERIITRLRAEGYELTRTHQLYEIPVGNLDAAFFVKIQGQLDLLLGPAKSAAEAEPVTTGA